MGTFAKVIVAVTCFHLAIFFFLNLSYTDPTVSPTRRMMASNPQDTTYEFVDPDMAYKILTQLDVFEPTYNGLTEKEGESLYQRAYCGFTADNNYCDKHRAYFAQNPNYVFAEKNFVTGYYPSDQIRNLTLERNYNNSMPHVGYHRPQSIINNFVFDMNLNVSLIATFEPMFYHRHVGRQFSCLGQMSNHIPGHEDLYRKDHAAEALNVYSEEYKPRPQCFDHSKFFPKNNLLFNKEQCIEFFQYFNGDGYKAEKAVKGTVYMRKIGAGVHAGQGVFPVDQAEEDMLRDLYKNGDACGKVTRNYIIQSFIHNPMLINGFKFDFRMFMVIASTNPFIAYYHDGFLRISGQEYDPFNGGKLSLLSNVAAGRMSFEEFRDHLLAKGEISDPNWLDNYLRPEFKKAMIHLVRMSRHSFLKRSSLFELYGIDFIIDENHNLWFIEANTQPGTNSDSVDGLKLKQDVLKNMFDIVFGLLRSRMKRVFVYVNDMIVNKEAIKLANGDVYIPNLQQKIREFREVSKNRMEPEFDVGSATTYSKIIDESLSGTKKYMDFISADCM